MSEHLRPEWLQIPHEDIECCLALNGLVRTFSTKDSAYWLYSERFSSFNHIVQWNDDGTYAYWFGCDAEDYDALHEAGITQISAPYPNDEVISHFWTIEMADFDNEMTYLERTGEIPRTD